jgi:transcriptional regulator with XRE-family HTH domain
MPANQSPELLVALGQAVRDRRRDRGLTQEQLAESAGLHPRYISDVERGRRNVGISNLDQLASALGLGLAQLMAEVERHRA